MVHKEIRAYIPTIQRSLLSWTARTKPWGMPCGHMVLLLWALEGRADRRAGQEFQKVTLTPSELAHVPQQPYLVHILAAQDSLGFACQALAFLQ